MEKKSSDSASDGKPDREMSEASHTSNGLKPTDTNVGKRETDLEQAREGAKDASEVQWTFKRCIAIAALCGSYVGKLP